MDCYAFLVNFSNGQNQKRISVIEDMVNTRVNYLECQLQFSQRRIIVG